MPKRVRTAFLYSDTILDISFLCDRSFGLYPCANVSSFIVATLSSKSLWAVFRRRTSEVALGCLQLTTQSFQLVIVCTLSNGITKSATDATVDATFETPSSMSLKKLPPSTTWSSSAPPRRRRMRVVVDRGLAGVLARRRRFLANAFQRHSFVDIQPVARVIRPPLRAVMLLAGRPARAPLRLRVLASVASESRSSIRTASCWLLPLLRASFDFHRRPRLRAHRPGILVSSEQFHLLSTSATRKKSRDSC